MTVRSDLAGILKPLLPKAWRVVPYNADLDVIDRPTVMLHHESIEPTPAAPMGGFQHNFKLYVIEAKTEPGAADDALDADVEQTIYAIEHTKGLAFTRANRVLWGDTNPAWEISLSVFSQKDNEA